MAQGISIEDAITSRFENSTREELLRYCEEVGVDIAPTSDMRSLKNALFSALGVPDRVEQAVASARPGKTFRSKIMPDVNLTPSGRWGGRRRRIRLPRPADATKNERAMPFGWNGKATYWLPFDEPVDVPYPIYMQLCQRKTRRPVTTKPNEQGEITTEWQFDNYVFLDLGDDPNTAHLPASLVDWYRDKGIEFFKELSLRDLQMVGGYLDINIRGEDKKPREQAEMLDLVLIFLFGFATDSLEEVEHEAEEA